jgi:hypothetical protein
MPVHDWTKVDAGIFHAFHHDWITYISRALNDGRMPPDYYALPEQITSNFGPDVLALQAPPGNGVHHPNDAHGSLLTVVAPRTRVRLRADVDPYVAKAKAVTVRHVSGHELVAVVEIVSPGNKDSALKLMMFAEKARAFLTNGVHLTLIDLHPPTPGSSRCSPTASAVPSTARAPTSTSSRRSSGPSDRPWPTGRTCRSSTSASARTTTWPPPRCGSG